MQKIPITTKGFARLQQELEELKRKRPQVSQAIAEARAHGDLRENAEYHAAKEQQGLMEARIRDLEFKIANAHVVNISTITETDKIVFGATVHLINIDNNEEIRYQIVGEEEANYKTGKISINSPIARALIGKYVDDLVAVQAPGGNIEYEISKIEYV